MMPLYDYLAGKDSRVMRDSRIPPELYRRVLEGTVPIFREGSLRNAFPTRIVNDPGRTQSRKIKVVDMGDAEHGMRGTGGTFDMPDRAYDDEVAYAIWKNWTVGWREGEADTALLQDAVDVSTQKVKESENKMLISGLGPVKGITTKTGIQTFAGATWATAGNAWKDLTKAIFDKLPTKKAPIDVELGVLVNPAEAAKLFNTFSNTSDTQLEKLKALLNGGKVYVTNEVTAGKAYVYPKTKTVVEYVVYQDLTLVPLPAIDEDTRGRQRVIGALHVPRTDGVVEITGIA